MSQLDFAGFFNQAEDPAPVPVAVPLAASAREPSPEHRMMSIETARKTVRQRVQAHGQAPAPLGRVQRLHYAGSQ